MQRAKHLPNSAVRRGLSVSHLCAFGRTLPDVLAGALPSRQNPRMRRLELYRFRYFDTLRQRWPQARYVLEAPAITCDGWHRGPSHTG